MGKWKPESLSRMHKNPLEREPYHNRWEITIHYSAITLKPHAEWSDFILSPANQKQRLDWLTPTYEITQGELKSLKESWNLCSAGTTLNAVRVFPDSVILKCCALFHYAPVTLMSFHWNWAEYIGQIFSSDNLFLSCLITGSVDMLWHSSEHWSTVIDSLMLNCPRCCGRIHERVRQFLPQVV